MEQEISIDQIKGTTQQVQLHDGGSIRLKKLDDNYDPHDRFNAIEALHASNREGKVLTGLIYIENQTETFHDMINVTETPLNQLKQEELCPGSDALQAINASLA
jgi:2-oxoglutarate ferredoxin oxidoreductase subunit beta